MANHSNEDISDIDLWTPVSEASVQQGQESLVESKDARRKGKGHMMIYYTQCVQGHSLIDISEDSTGLLQQHWS